LSIATRQSITTLSFSRPGELTHKVIRPRDDPSGAMDETMVYRYDPEGRRIGEYVIDGDGNAVPLQLYAYIGNGQVFAKAAYHLCRTFSSLHLYAYDESARLVMDTEFASRRLTRREFHYDEKGQVGRITTHRNGRLLSKTRYAYDGLGRLATVTSDQPDGGVMSRVYRYDKHGNVLAVVETHPHDPAHDKTEILTYGYDLQGNWTRRTIIRVVNPLDEEGHPLEEPVQVIEREIVYADGSDQ
jgi:YD repeat-containing protein